MAQTVIGIFRDADKAQQAVDQLLSNGFSESNVDLSSQRLTDTNRHDHQESGKDRAGVYKVPSLMNGGCIAVNKGDSSKN